MSKQTKLLFFIIAVQFIVIVALSGIVDVGFADGGLYIKFVDIFSDVQTG